MKATFMYAAGDVRLVNVPDATLKYPTDAVVRITRACVCGSDLWPYQQMPSNPQGQAMGHEFIGIVEAVGSEVRTLKKGDLVVAPFAYSDGTCEFCQEGEGIWGHRHRVGPGRGRHSEGERPDGRPFVHSVLECVGHGESMLTAVSIARAGGFVGRVGVPQEQTIPGSALSFFRNVTISGGPAPVRAYIEELLPDVLEGRIRPGKVFDATLSLDQVAEGYLAMNERRVIKALIRPAY